MGYGPLTQQMGSEENAVQSDLVMLAGNQAATNGGPGLG
jgi:hypothetical protein